MNKPLSKQRPSHARIFSFPVGSPPGPPLPGVAELDNPELANQQQQGGECEGGELAALEDSCGALSRHGPLSHKTAAGLSEHLTNLGHLSPRRVFKRYGWRTVQKVAGILWTDEGTPTFSPSVANPVGLLMWELGQRENEPRELHTPTPGLPPQARWNNRDSRSQLRTLGLIKEKRPRPTSSY